MIKIGKVIGDVIEAGGVKKVTTIIYGGGQPKQSKQSHDVQLEREDIPEKLRGDAAEELMEDLVDGGILTEDWQPNGLSGAERGLVASTVCQRLGIHEVWQVFGQLWHEKPETLRGYFNKALNQEKSLAFQEKLKNIID